MGVKYEQRDLDQITSTAESLKKAAEQLTQVAIEMHEHGLADALFPWTKRQFDCLDVIITLASQCQMIIPAQILAKKQGRQSKYEVMQIKSRRDAAAKKRREKTSAEPPKPRGRPKKKKT